jgi:hypothetical protein
VSWTVPLAVRAVIEGVCSVPYQLEDTLAQLPWDWAGPHQAVLDALVDASRAGDLENRSPRQRAAQVAKRMAPEAAADPEVVDGFAAEYFFGHDAHLRPAIEFLRGERVRAALAGLELDPEDSDGSPVERAQSARDQIDLVLLDVNSTTSKPLPMDEVLSGPGGLLEDWMAEPTWKGGRRLSTPWPSITDALDGGFLPGTFNLIAARTSVGKTALALQLAVHIADEIGPVLFESLEMSKRSLLERALHGLGVAMPARGEPSTGFGRNQPNTVNDARDAAERMRRLFVDDPARPDMAYLRGRARQLHAQHGLKAIFIDYVSTEKIKPEPGVSRFDATSAMVGELSALARELGVPVFALAQINRQGAGKQTVPELHHLKDTGSFEQDADTAILLDGQPGSESVEAMLAKNRHGRVPARPVKLTRAGTFFKEASASIF